MYAVLLLLAPLILSFGVLLAGSSAQFVLLGLRAPIEGISVGWMGVISAAYFAGFGIGSLYCPKLVKEIGHIRTFAALASVASGLALLLALWPTPYGWLILRLVTGFCFAGLYTVVESWMNARSPNEYRGRILSIYGVTIFGGFAIGPLIANLGDPGGLMLFAIASILISFALVPVTLTRAGAPMIKPDEEEDEAQPRRYGLVRLFRETPLGVIGSFCVGALQGSFTSLASVYGASAGLDGEQTAFLVTAGLLAGLVAQYPLGWLSDRLDRRAVIVGVTVIGGGALLALYVTVLAHNPTYLMIMVASVLTGAAIFPIYALIIAHTNDWLPESSLVPAAAALLLMNSFGGMFGNIAASTSMNIFGPDSFFLFMACLNLAFGLFVLERMRRRPAPESENTAYDYTPAALGTVPFGGAYEPPEAEEEAEPQPSQP
ncbi:MAG: MFS transporter [Pseudomonadota bacterium]